MLLNLRESFLGCRRFHHLIAAGQQGGAEDQAQRQLILDNQDSGRQILHTLPNVTTPLYHGQ